MRYRYISIVRCILGAVGLLAMGTSAGLGQLREHIEISQSRELVSAVLVDQAEAEFIFRFSGDDLLVENKLRQFAKTNNLTIVVRRLQAATHMSFLAKIDGGMFGEAMISNAADPEMYYCLYWRRHTKSFPTQILNDLKVRFSQIGAALVTELIGADAVKRFRPSKQ